MSAPSHRTVTVNGQPCRVLEKGTGPKLGFLAGFLGLPSWSPFLDRLSHHFHVISPSLPGFPGATGHEQLDHLIDWVTASLDLLEASGLAGEDVIGASIGGLIAAEVAALSPTMINRLVLMAPLGLYDEAAPIPHLWAKRSADLIAFLTARKDELDRFLAKPDGIDQVEWNIVMARTSAAGARLLWPMCDLGLNKRLHRIRNETALLWGDKDQVMPASYAKLFEAGIAGSTMTKVISGAGHLIDIDEPAAAAQAVMDFLNSERAVKRKRG
jgi:pimeloyl-ACP methyl ester carboxylesterase